MGFEIRIVIIHDIQIMVAWVLRKLSNVMKIGL